MLFLNKMPSSGFFERTPLALETGKAYIRFILAMVQSKPHRFI